MSSRADAPVVPFLEGLILYEDFATGLRAKRSLDLLPAQLGAHPQWSTKLWRIELLSDPLLKEQAAREAASADVIVLSLHGGRALSADVRGWLTCWQGYKQNRPYALGVLLDAGQAGQGGENPVLAYMRQVAAAAGADLFYGFSEPPANELDAALEEISQRAHRSSTLLDDMLQSGEARRRRGLNK